VPAPNEMAGPMTRSIAVVALVLATSAVGTALSGCSGQHPFIRDGDANSVEITYPGGDAASALPLARQHCARYERVPRFVNAGPDVGASADTALFDCVPP
jgi:hypothetical protein